MLFSKDFANNSNSLFIVKVANTVGKIPIPARRELTFFIKIKLFNINKLKLQKKVS